MDTPHLPFPLQVIARRIPVLPRSAWLLLGGDVMYWTASGTALAFLVVYLRDVRALSLPMVGLTLGVAGAAGLAGSLLSGNLADRIGPRSTLIGALILTALGAVLYLLTRSLGGALLAAIVAGAGHGAAVAATLTFLSAIVLPGQRATAFSLRYAGLNVGIGLGGVLGGFLLDPRHAITFVVMYGTQAALLVGYAVVLMSQRGVPTRLGADGPAPVTHQNVSHPVRDRSFLLVCTIATLLTTVGLSQFSSGLAAFATAPGRLDLRMYGLVLAVNTLGVILFQLPALRLLAGRRRTAAVQVLCALWTAAWLTVGASGAHGGSGPTWLRFALAALLFALGEVLLPPSLLPLVNDLTPGGWHGRYNAIFSSASALGHLLGPAIAGLLLGAGQEQGFLGAMLLGCGVVVLLAHHLTAYLPPETNFSPLPNRSTP